MFLPQEHKIHMFYPCTILSIFFDLLGCDGKICLQDILAVLTIRYWNITYVSVKSKLQHPPPPGYLTPFPAQEGGDLITTHRGWGIWSLDKRICGGLVQNQRPTQAVFRLWRCLRTIYIYLWVYKYFKLYLQYKQLLNTKPLSSDTIYWGQLLWPTWCIYECLNTFCDNVFVGV